MQLYLSKSGALGVVSMSPPGWVLDEATIQASKQALKRHSVGAMSCWGLLKLSFGSLKKISFEPLKQSLWNSGMICDGGYKCY